MICIMCNVFKTVQRMWCQTVRRMWCQTVQRKWCQTIQRRWCQRKIPVLYLVEGDDQ